jgi:hypothetical protein
MPDPDGQATRIQLRQGGYLHGSKRHVPGSGRDYAQSHAQGTGRRQDGGRLSESAAEEAVFHQPHLVET